jgi:hypothetical protein
MGNRVALFNMINPIPSQQERSDRNATMKITAYNCICSTLFIGCYSSAMITLTGDDKEKMYTGRIHFIITKDGTKYEFDTLPMISNDSFAEEATNKLVSIPLSEMVIGISGGKEVAIPLSDVDKVLVHKFDTGRTIGAVVGTVFGVALVGFIVFAATFKMNLGNK